MSSVWPREADSVDAVERRDAFLVSEADAAVAGWADRDPDIRRALRLVEWKELSVRVIGGPVKAKAARRMKEPVSPMTRGLPD